MYDRVPVTEIPCWTRRRRSNSPCALLFPLIEDRDANHGCAKDDHGPAKHDGTEPTRLFEQETNDGRAAQRAKAANEEPDAEPGPHFVLVLREGHDGRCHDGVEDAGRNAVQDGDEDETGRRGGAEYAKAQDGVDDAHAKEQVERAVVVSKSGRQAAC